MLEIKWNSMCIKLQKKTEINHVFYEMDENCFESITNQ